MRSSSLILRKASSNWVSEVGVVVLAAGVFRELDERMLAAVSRPALASMGTMMTL